MSGYKKSMQIVDDVFGQKKYNSSKSQGWGVTVVVILLQK